MLERSHHTGFRIRLASVRQPDLYLWIEKRWKRDGQVVDYLELKTNRNEWGKEIVNEQVHKAWT